MWFPPHPSLLAELNDDDPILAGVRERDDAYPSLSVYYKATMRPLDDPGLQALSRMRTDLWFFSLLVLSSGDLSPLW